MNKKSKRLLAFFTKQGMYLVLREIIDFFVDNDIDF